MTDKLVCTLCGEELKRTSRHKLYFTIHIDSDFGDTPDITAHCCTKCYDKLLSSLNIPIPRKI